MKIYTIGGSGLVGSRVIELLQKNHQITDLSVSNGVDITIPESLDVIKNDTEHELVIQFAAKADVDGCEKDKPLGEEGAAFKINVTGTQHVAAACKIGNKKMIYVSTDFVFGGNDTPEGGYTEEDNPNPLGWYAETKEKGEEVVKKAGVPYIIMRIAYPYRKEFDAKKDFVRAVGDRLAQGLPIKAITDHIFTPTFIDDIAPAIEALIKNDATGIYHVVGDQSLSPYDASVLIAKTFGYDQSLIGKTIREEFFAGRAPRPFDLTINNAKIEKLGVTMKTFEQGLQAMKD
jgi:dTDP-4-dehydrorhamnose reductase